MQCGAEVCLGHSRRSRLAEQHPILAAVCVQTVHSILSMSAKHASHIQMPVLHQQTQMKAVIKHRRYLGDQFMLAGLDVLQQLSLTFDKSNLPAGNKRPPWHPCLFITSSWGGWNVGCMYSSRYKVDRAMPSNSCIRYAWLRCWESASTSWAFGAVFWNVCSLSCFCFSLCKHTVSHCLCFCWKRFFVFSCNLFHFAINVQQKRKGVPAHAMILESYTRGMTFGEDDVLIVADILPNRPGVTSRFWVQSSLGIHFDSGGNVNLDVLPCKKFWVGRACGQALLTLDSWDLTKLTSNPILRKLYIHTGIHHQELPPEPSFGFLTWSNGVARFPESAFQKFPEGSPHYPEPVEMKKKLVQEFPSPATVAATTPQSSQLGPQESPTSLLMEERNHSMSCVSWSWKLLRPMPCQLKGPLGWKIHIMFYQEVWFLGLSYVLFHLWSDFLFAVWLCLEMLKLCKLGSADNTWCSEVVPSHGLLVVRKAYCGGGRIQTISAGWKGPLFMDRKWNHGGVETGHIGDLWLQPWFIWKQGSCWYPDWYLYGWPCILWRGPLSFCTLHCPTQLLSVVANMCHNSWGMGEAEVSGVCFRFKDDLSLVVHEKKLLSLAEYAHLCCAVHGVANFKLAKTVPPCTLISYSHALICESSSFAFCMPWLFWGNRWWSSACALRVLCKPSWESEMQRVHAQYSRNCRYKAPAVEFFFQPCGVFLCFQLMSYF